MRLKFITCSGVNEFTDIPQLVELLVKYPITEIGIQVSQKKCSFGSPRFEWLKKLNEYVNKHNILINVALHLNGPWVENFCFGKVAPEIEELLSLEDCYGCYFIKRVQLNFKIGREKEPNPQLLTQTINKFPLRRFILSFNESNENLIRTLYRSGLVFDCLYDASFGEGIAPEERGDVAFIDIVQGYAGGLSPQNVASELRKIDDVVNEYADVYIDAEGKLKDESGHVSVENCTLFVQNALSWQDD